MEIVYKSIDELTPYENNPRHNENAVAAVAASIKEFNFKVPLVIDTNGVVVAGHTRLLAARQLGLSAVPCIIADDLTPEQIRAFRLADNKTAELAGWDFAKLEEELANIEIDMSAFGFSMDLIEEPQEVVEDEVPEVDEQVAPTTQLGDVWKLGRHRLMCGDSTDTEGLNFRSALKEAGLQLRQTLIWNKNSMTLGRQDYQWKHEPCLYGWKDGASHNWYSDRCQTTVLDFDKPSRSEQHPTMKPVALFAYQIECSSKKGDIVLDLFGGSGTTGIACEQTGRCAYLMELDPKYCDVIIKRWEALSGQKAELLNR